MGNGNQRLLGETPVKKLIWKMAIPSIMGVMAYNLYNIVDTFFISKGVGANAVGGVSVSFPLFIFLSAVSSTLGSGAASVISRALGQKDYEKANRAAANTFGLFYLLAIMVTVFGLIYLEQLLYMMGVTDALMPYAKRYTRIILMGAVTSTGFSNLIRAEGSSKYAMYIWVIPMSVNVILDPIFIFGLDMGVIGAAAATVVSQCVSMGMFLYYFFISGKSILRIRLRHFIPDKKLLCEIFFIGLPSFLQMIGHAVSIIIVNQFLKKYGGDLSINTYGVVSKINTFFSIPVTGFVQGLSPIIGYNKGAGKIERVRESIKFSLCVAGAYSFWGYVVIMVLASQLMYIFTDDNDMIVMGSHVLKIVNLGILCSSLQSVQSAYFQAVGEKKASLLVALCNQILCFIPILLMMSKAYGLDGVWYAFPMSTTIAVIISTIVLRKILKKEEEGI